VTDIIPIGMVLLFGTLLLVTQQKHYTNAEFRWVQLSFAAHVIASFAQLYITEEFYGSGDMTEYARQGTLLAEVLRIDFFRFAPEVAKILIHQEPFLPINVETAGTSTGTMAGIAGFLLFVLGDSTSAACLFIGLVAFFGKTVLYRALRPGVAVEHHGRLLGAILLVPSVVFWSCGILKESVAIGAVGLMVLGVRRVLESHLARGVVLVAIGVVIVGFVKAYILFPFALGTGVWLYWERASRRGVQVALKPMYLVLGLLVALGGVVLLGRIFPAYAFDRLGEATARQQEVGEYVGGGSYYQIGNPTERSLSGQLAFAPLALVTSLFRPVVFEARSPLVLVNALETLALTLLFLRALLSRPWTQTWAYLRSSPVLMMAIVFIVTFGTAVGLATTNLGTLSRYRMPLVPFFAAVILVLNAPTLQRARIGAAAPKQAPITSG
jgi:hypothetical protein